MKKLSISRTSSRPAASKTDWPRIKAMRDADIDLSDLPEITAEKAAHGVVRVAGKVVPRGKTRLTMYLDAAVVEFFKARAGARGEGVTNSTPPHPPRARASFRLMG